jgi:hypothetical protein
MMRQVQGICTSDRSSTDQIGDRSLELESVDEEIVMNLCLSLQ